MAARSSCSSTAASIRATSLRLLVRKVAGSRRRVLLCRRCWLLSRRRIVSAQKDPEAQIFTAAMHIRLCETFDENAAVARDDTLRRRILGLCCQVDERQAFRIRAHLINEN